MITRRPMPINTDISMYNNHNLHQFDPYIFKNDGILLIDVDWFNSLTPYIRDLIDSRLNKRYELGHVIVPHELQTESEMRELTTVYYSYIDGFDYNVWYSPEIPDGPSGVTVIRITDVMKMALHHKQVSNLDALKDEIQSKMLADQSYFVRLSGTSGKNEKPVRPFDNAIDIIKHLVSVKLFDEREYSRDKKTCLILIPWNDKIDYRCEFRIFVVNNQLVAASPQHFSSLYQYSMDQLDSIEHALSNIKFINKVPYDTFIADVYIDTELSVCHLIELNPFGAHSGAGSSFFNWILDYDLLHNINNKNCNAELRYLSAINY